MPDDQPHRPNEMVKKLELFREPNVGAIFGTQLNDDLLEEASRLLDRPGGPVFHPRQRAAAESQKRPSIQNVETLP